MLIQTINEFVSNLYDFALDCHSIQQRPLSADRYGDIVDQSLAVGKYADLTAALDAAGSQPLWDRYHRLTRREPAAADSPWHWAWADMEPLVERAVREVALEDAERRVLLLAHPAFPESAASTTNLSSGLQTLMPGEVARAHRHSLQAIRFVLDGGGAVTSVNDQRCPMQEGDLILTPAWTWHEHVHPGQGRVVWFDGLDLPLCRHLDSVFFERAGPQTDTVDPPPTRAAALRTGAVALPPDAFDLRSGGSSRFRYAWERALSALSAATPQPDGSRLLRYVNGESQGAVLPTLDCYLMSAAHGQPTRRYRSTSNAVCVVARGQGSSLVGERAIAWQRNDVFTLPHWNWVSHTATSDDAVLFMMTDRELLAAIGYLREQEEAP